MTFGGQARADAVIARATRMHGRNGAAEARQPKTFHAAGGHTENHGGEGGQRVVITHTWGIVHWQVVDAQGLLVA